MLLPAGGTTSTYLLLQPPEPCPPQLPAPLSPKHSCEGSPFPQCPPTCPALAMGCGRTRVPDTGASVSHLPQLSPSPVGTLPSLLLNGT